MNTEKMMSMVNEALRMAKEADAKLGLDDLEQASGGNVIAGPEDIRRMMGGDEPEELGKISGRNQEIIPPERRLGRNGRILQKAGAG